MDQPGKNEENDAPGREFMEQMRQVEIDRLRAMDCFAESSQKLPNDHLIVKARDKTHPHDCPNEKDNEGDEPGPPPEPGGRLARFATPPLVTHDARKEEGIDDRAFD